MTTTHQGTSGFYWRDAGAVIRASLVPMGFPFLVLLVGQYLGHRLDANGAASPFWDHPLTTMGDQNFERNAKVVFLNWAVLTAVWAPLVLVFAKRPRIAAFAFVGLYAAVVAANALKIRYRADPVHPWDLDQLWQMRSLVGDYLTADVAAMIALFVAAGLATWFWHRKRIDPDRLSRIQRVIAGIAWIVSWSMTAYVILVMAPNHHLKNLRDLDTQVIDMVWAPVSNADVNLLPLSLAFDLHFVVPGAPSGYDKSQLSELVTAPAPLPVRDPATTSKPDIVIVLSESFFPLKQFSTLRFTRDVTPNFSAAFKTSGAKVAVPAFGGGTANVEFELLTGLRMAFLPTGAVPYMQYIRQSLPDSFPALLKQQGYRTTAIHPFYKTFWNRTNVYPLLGFDRFIDQADFQTTAAIRGPFISDAAMVEKITSTLDDGVGPPQFLFAVSMENHGAYADPQRYQQRTVRSIGAPTDEMRVVLDNYAEGLRDADVSFARLSELVKRRQRPTILIFFGDHLSIPIDMLHDVNVVSTDQYDDVPASEQKIIHEVGAVMMSNIDGVGWKDKRFEINDLAYQVLRAAQLPIPRYWQLIDQLARRVPTHLPEYHERPDGQLSKDTQSIDRSYRRTMELLTYDVLFGNQHLVRGLRALPPPS